ncbi:MAG: class I SAM-dependent methyltransferase [Promethearchaeia archaeon]
MYEEYAELYDLIYHYKDYKGEVKKIKKLIKKYKRSKGNKLLDVACGTGTHLKFLQEGFQCTGLDKSEQLLKIAKAKVKNVIFIKEDMLKMDLDEKFDVITCLFSAINYVKTLSNLKKVLMNFYNHLNEGGIAILEPFFTKETYLAGTAHMSTYDGEDIKIARLNISDLKEDVAYLKMHYLVAKSNDDVVYFTDLHELALFEIEDFLNVMNEVGFESQFLEKGLMKNRGLYIGIKPKD